MDPVDAAAERHQVPVREGYDRWAAVYDGDGNPMVALEQRWFDALLGAVRGLDVVDLGCGTGRHALRLAAAGATVTGVEVSPGMLARARAAAARGGVAVRLLEHDLHRPLPFGDGSFDVAVSGLVLEHLLDLGAFYREVARVLRPGGHAVLSTIHPAMALRSAQARFTDPDTGEVVHVAGRPQSFAELVQPLRAVGLDLLEVQEHAPDAALAAVFPRAQKYVGWPMLLLLRVGRRA